MARLILDPGVVVAAVRGHLDLNHDGMSEQDDVASPAVAWKSLRPWPKSPAATRVLWRRRSHPSSAASC